MDKIRTIIEKEWAEVFKNRLVLFTVAFLPLVLIAMPLVMLALIGNEMPEGEGLPDALVGTMCVGLNEIECFQMYLLSIFTVMLMILPVMIPVSIAAYSIVGEKTTRSLEPLLATPITTVELLTGKILAAVLPAITVTWLSYLIFLAGVRLLTGPAVVSGLLAPLWLLAVLVVGPLLALFSVSIAIMVSSRVSDPRVAEQLSGAVILPIVLLIVGQSIGFILLSQELILVIAAVVAILDVGILFLVTQVFERETILTRWK
jgi:ABC-2 type transport system permease protein